MWRVEWGGRRERDWGKGQCGVRNKRAGQTTTEWREGRRIVCEWVYTLLSGVIRRGEERKEFRGV